MARRKRNTRHAPSPIVLRNTPGREVLPAPKLSTPTGLNYLSQVNEIGPNELVQLHNAVLEDGNIKSRPGTTWIGSDIAASIIVGVFRHLSAAKISYIFRVLADSVSYWNGASWTTATGLTFTGTSADKFSSTIFGSDILFSNHVDKIFAYAVESDTATELTAGPIAKFISTFAGRVVATDILEGDGKPEDIRWSAKNNSLVWDVGIDIGAGSESLISTPGGEIDANYKLFPITDTVALLPRSNSMWQVTTTGIAAAPFRFERLYATMGSNAPYSYVEVPGGLAFVGFDDIYIVTNTQVQKIGTKIIDQILSETTDVANILGIFDPVRLEYLIKVPIASGTYVYRYSFKDQGWSRNEYFFAVGWMDYGNSGNLPFSIGQLTGTIGDLVGTIGDLSGGASGDQGLLLSDAGAGRFVTQQDISSGKDQITASVFADKTMEIRTGAIIASSPGFDTTINGIELFYNSTAIQTLNIEYSLDAGTTWNAFSTVPIIVQTIPQLLKVHKTITGRIIQVRIRTTTLGGLTIYGLIPYVSQGPLVNR